MKSTDPLPLERLQALVHESASSPADAAAALAAARAEVTAEPATEVSLAHELLADELRWLEASTPIGVAPAADLLAARRAWLALRVRGLSQAEPDVVVLLDLAEAQAAAEMAGERALAVQCQAAIDRGVPRVRSAGEAEQEVGERFAVLSTAIDELTVAHQVRLLRDTSRVVAGIAQGVGSTVCRRFARRLGRAADDRELARRLEALVGRRGVTAIESTNFALLLVVLVTLGLEAVCNLTDTELLILHWIDALACLFFIADFCLELALHPSRWSWFCRNALTDLVPAVPSVLFLMPVADVPGVAENIVLLRVLRLLRVTWAARYVQALRPLLRSARLLLFLVRGLDGLTARFAQILNREFVLVPAAGDERRPIVEQDRRDTLFAALNREHELLELVHVDRRQALQRQRAQLLQQTIASSPPLLRRGAGTTFGKDVPVEQAIEFLWSLRPQDIGRWLKPADVQALDRVIRVLSVVPVRWLPLIRRIAVHPLPSSAEQRIVQLARRVADWVESWHGRMLFFADLHGIVTGPQILDRVASAMVRASQRPAVRLLLFGGLFSVLRLFWENNPLSSLVGLPLVLLGGVCLVFLAIGHWLKRLAGQASEAFRLTSEAHFISQIELVKRRYEQEDLDFLARRVFGSGAAGAAARPALQAQLAHARAGVPVADASVPLDLRLAVNRLTMLYLHFLDGAPLHISDVKTTEQLLANQSIENLRQRFLGAGPRERKRLRRLKLDDGTVFSGPYLWFSFITESIAVEAAKRIAGYNRYCVPLAERPLASASALQDMHDWLERRRDPRGGRTSADASAATAAASYPTTEFTALDFVGGDPERDRHLAALFGDEVVQVLRLDRRTMIREIFGTRPVHQLPKQQRSFNPLRFYQRRLSRGRVLLAPLLLAFGCLRSISWLIRRVRQIVREVMNPELALRRREIGEAPFAVALRKIHRMKAPGLLEGIRMRLQLDPCHSGAPAGWSNDEPFAAEPAIERDLRFLHLREREAAELRQQAASIKAHVDALHAALPILPSLGEPADADARAAGELAVTCAWIADKDRVRTLLFAERWRSEVLTAMLAEDRRLSRGRRLWLMLQSLFQLHPVDRWLERHGRGLPANAAPVLRRAWVHDQNGTRDLLAAWLELPAETSPAATAIAILRDAYRHGHAVRRDLMALRAVQSMAVLDVRNYRDLVFVLGDYEADGEVRARAAALP